QGRQPRGLRRDEQATGHDRVGVKMAKAVTVYGIKNCDTMKKARAWLDKRGVIYEFHDYKSAGIERSMLEGWSRQRAGRRSSIAPAARSARCRRRTRSGSPRRRRSR